MQNQWQQNNKTSDGAWKRWWCRIDSFRFVPELVLSQCQQSTWYINSIRTYHHVHIHLVGGCAIASAHFYVNKPGVHATAISPTLSSMFYFSLVCIRFWSIFCSPLHTLQAFLSQAIIVRVVRLAFVHFFILFFLTHHLFIVGYCLHGGAWLSPLCITHHFLMD